MCDPRARRPCMSSVKIAHVDPTGTMLRIRERTPLVHCVTNFVSMDLVANVLLAAGASPACVHAPEETLGFATIAGALVINVGTIDALWLEGMQRAAIGVCC